MIKYEVEPITEKLFDEMWAVLETQRLELVNRKDMHLNPYIAKYLLMEKSKQAFIVVARDDNNTIVGYSAWFVSPNMHYMDFIDAHQDVFYVVDGKRGTRIAMKLLKKCEEELKLRNVDNILQHTKVSNNFGRFLEKMGYGVAEVIYSKRLK